MKTFRLKKKADVFETRSRFEITQGTHTPDSASITIAEAADLWIETCAGRRLERSTIDSEFEDRLRRGVPPQRDFEAPGGQWSKKLTFRMGQIEPGHPLVPA
jgi:hypothetical protein